MRPQGLSLEPRDAGARATMMLPAALKWQPVLLRGMSWERVLWLFGIATAFALSSVSGALIRAAGWPYPGWRDFVLELLSWFVRYLVDFAPILVAMTIADNLPFTGRSRFAALALAFIVGAQFQWPIRCVYEPETEAACDDFPAHLGQSYAEMLGENTLWTMAFGLPIVLTYFDRRRDARMAQSLHAAELARSDLQRRKLETDLQTLQSRIEPTFLFETLGDIGALYDRDPAKGERMMDDLIDYLRAALPDMRTTHSTLRQEVALASSYLGIMRMRSDGALSFDVGIAKDIGDVPLPPMIVLPLLAAAVDPSGAEVSPTTLRVDTLADAQRVRLAITGRGGALRPLAGTAALPACRARLRTLFDERATLVVDEEPGRLTAVVELPND